MRLLVIEDEKDLNRLIVDRLLKDGYAVDYCYDGVSAIDYITLGHYDGVIMDLMIPRMDGHSVLKTIRELKIYTPVMILSALSDPENIVAGLDGGADDYMTKPFDFDVLLARIRAMLRKTVGVHETVYRLGDLEVNESGRTVFRAGKELDLTTREFDILMFFIRNANIVLTREQIISGVWNDGEELTSNVVDVYVRFLRRKLDDPFEYKMIKTVRGMGYCLKSED